MTSAKWMSSQVLTIVQNAEDQHPHPSARKIDPTEIARVGGSVTLSRLLSGTLEGSSVAILQIDLDDGTTVILETTLRLLANSVKALAAIDREQGRPGWD